MATAFDLPVEASADPDLQATITDFADYTEYFPSDLFRSLTLIRQLDEEYQKSTDNLHQFTKTYASLPSLTAADRPDATALRQAISTSLDRASRCRELSRAEAERLCGQASRLSTRLTDIREKLEAQPKPPSREPTPPPSRSRRTDVDRTPRIKLSYEASSRKPRTGRLSSRRIIVPGEVLPPRDPNSPSPSAASDDEHDRASPTPRPTARALKFEKEKTPKPRKTDKEKAEKVPKPPRVRTPGTLGSNAHSQKVGISVSNAMAQLAPPPENPPPGSKYAPWMKLSEYELLKIRKSMKKNADWMPSDIMVSRYLEQHKRGHRYREAARREAKETGEDFIDEQPEIFVRPSVPRYRSSEGRSQEEDEKLAERGMKLNESKKRKKAQQKAEEKMDRDLADVLADPSVPESAENEAQDIVAQSTKNNKKRKRASEAQPDVDDQPARPAKMIKLKPPGPSGHPSDPLQAEDTKPSRRRASAKPTATATPEPVEMPTSRPRARSTIKLHPPKVTRKKAASVEPEKPAPRITLRRGSDAGPANARTIQLNTETAASRRGKRAAPGVLTNLVSEGGARTSIAKRKSAPGKRGSTTPAPGVETALVPAIDYGDEELYCLCRQPDFGQMIGCDSPNCEIEWYHVACVGLEEMSNKIRLSRLTWYCPLCRGSFSCDAKGIKLK